MTQQRMESGPQRNELPLAGQCVACTGRLASMTRAEAVTLIQSCGGQPTPSVSRQTTMLVVGEEGWPLKQDGRLTRKLQAARKRRNSGAAIEVLREGEFLRRIEGHNEQIGVCDAYSMFELSRLLGVGRDRLRAWQRAGLIEPQSDDGASPATFDFRQVSRAKTLVELAESGVSVRHLRRSLQQLRGWIPDVDESLDWLVRLRREGHQLVLQTPSGECVEPSGQRRFDFDDDHGQSSVPFVVPVDREDDLFDRALRSEEAGDFTTAVDAYHRLLEIEGPDPEVCFNLGNALYALGQSAAAVERFRQAVELDPTFAEAWLNLGNVLCELGLTVQALRVFQQTLAIEPDLADAHYSLADTLEEMGRGGEAQRHWRAYLDHEAYGEWAEYARSRLASRA